MTLAGRCRLLVPVFLCAVLVFGASNSASADRRTDYLIGLLANSDTFRVRAQAAISLGRMEASEQLVEALTAALRDAHPGVRTAAAASLERLADVRALPALQAARSDGDSSARRAIRSAQRALERVAAREPTADEPDTSNAQYYVGVGVPGGQNVNLSRSALQTAQEFLRGQVASLSGVRIAPDGESNGAATRAIRSGRMTGYFIDSSVVRVEETASGTRVVVSVIVGTYPGRDMRAILQGAATVPGASGEAAVRAALEGALRGAIRRLPQAMEGSRR